MTPLPINITRNFVFNNYNSVWSLCHDDGSNSYIDTFNLLPWSGSKNYLGFNKTTENNYFVMADAAPLALARAAARAGGAHASPGGPPLDSGWNACVMSYGEEATAFPDTWRNNTCTTAKASFFSLSGCNDAAPLNGTLPRLAGNTWAADSGNYSLKCGKSSWTLAEAQARGVDVGSVVVPSPSTADVIAAGRALLQM